ncbi:fumarylacetoacetate hydrolase family protein [Microbacterium esteraromaticum]|uniref:fumarylacetoacetate hydrolase family protein n=1 Tax=Microbacterium esteraromaticum TaxID=57043 RepID=UPI001CD2907E|nr:fumarylacetoacetate hydrolase family protein [Microbacterium esteraromaticum]MCA1307855.1 fumarylacetoacetate hydrolase family protein [Microbacterium esteraromaticum]
MRYASYLSSNQTPTWGVEIGDELVDLGPTGLGVAPTLKAAVIAGGPIVPMELGDAPRIAVADAVFLPVVVDPEKIVCIGVNYRTHQDETGRADVAHPVVFSRWADTLAGAGAEVALPRESTMYDYEGEVALVIGKPAYKVAAADAFDYVAGYANFNDFSARDWQRHTGQWIPGKNFPESGTFGPFYVPSGDIDDIRGATLVTRVNGEVRQSASVADLIFDIPEIIEYVTSFTRLAAGDVIVTGTPGGVGLFMDPPTFLRPGDVVEVEATGLGILTNRLV